MKSCGADFILVLIRLRDETQTKLFIIFFQKRDLKFSRG
jgi:hypothetical protein